MKCVNCARPLCKSSDLHRQEKNLVRAATKGLAWMEKFNKLHTLVSRPHTVLASWRMILKIAVITTRVWVIQGP